MIEENSPDALADFQKDTSQYASYSESVAAPTTLSLKKNALKRTSIRKLLLLLLL